MRIARCLRLPANVSVPEQPSTNRELRVAYKGDCGSGFAVRAMFKGDIMSRRALELFSEAADHVRSDLELSKMYSLVESALSELVGFRLLTILRIEGGQVRRMHSSDPVSYPVRHQRHHWRRLVESDA